MNGQLEFTEKDRSELIYLLYNAPVDIAHKNKRIIPMNSFWYPSEDGVVGEAFETFHEAVVWLMNPFWEQANGHKYE